VFCSGLLSDKLEDVSLSEFDERTRSGLERIQPRNLATNPRCPDCWDGPVIAGQPGPMVHPAGRLDRPAMSAHDTHSRVARASQSRSGSPDETMLRPALTLDAIEQTSAGLIQKLGQLPLENGRLSSTDGWWHISCHARPRSCVMKLKDIMSRDVKVVEPEATLAQAATAMQQLNVGILPVCAGDTLLGVVTDRDITLRAVALGREPAQTTVQQVMTQELVYCFDDQDVGAAARLMEDKQLRRLIVVNRDKRLVGIVSLGDLAIETANERLAGQVLERISTPVHPRGEEDDRS
jgi:CBS domain-containing protein